MDRINGAGHVNHRFVTEDSGQNRPPTEITDIWLNGQQEEGMSIIEGEGLVPSAADNTQIYQAIRKIFQRAAPVSAVASGTVNAMTANFDPPITALTNHLRVTVRAGGPNTTTTPTFTPNSAVIPAWPIVKGHNQPLALGDISGAGFRAELQYDAPLNKWVLLNPATGVSSTDFMPILATYGIGTSDAPDYTGDLNALTVGGMYLAAGGANRPGNTDCMVWVISNAGGNTSQIAIVQGGVDMYFRTCTGSVWGSWIKVNPAATTASKGDVQLAVNAEAQALADVLKVLTPATLNAAFKGANQSLTTNGQQKLPGGFILKWVVGASDPADTTETTQNLTYAQAFPNASLAEWVNTRIASASNLADVFYSTFGPSASGCSVQRQVTSSPQNNRVTTPILFAFGY